MGLPIGITNGPRKLSPMLGATHIGTGENGKGNSEGCGLSVLVLPVGRRILLTVSL